MGFVFDFYPSMPLLTKAILGTGATILLLITVELLEVSHDYSDVKDIFRPIIFGFIITFIFIVISRLSEVL